MKKRATLKHIADSLNLSVSTVSRILNGRGDYSEKTKSAVKEVAKMLDYRPHSIAVSLRKQTANKVIGVILPEVKHYFFSSILDGILESCHKQGYMVMIGESLHDGNMEGELINKFIDHFVSGIIISPCLSDGLYTNVKTLQKKEIPTVVIDRALENIDTSYVRHDDYLGAFDAVDHLLAKGARHIGLIKGPDNCIISEGRTRGYIDAHAKWNVSVGRENIISSSTIMTPELGYNLFKTLYERKKLDAVFSITDILAAGVYIYANEKNINIPNDLMVIGYSNSFLSSVLNPKLTTVEQNGQSMGETSFQYLLRLIENPEDKGKITFETQLIIRDSCTSKRSFLE